MHMLPNKACLDVCRACPMLCCGCALQTYEKEKAAQGAFF